jgi:hypothetical protein
VRSGSWAYTALPSTLVVGQSHAVAEWIALRPRPYHTPASSLVARAARTRQTKLLAHDPSAIWVGSFSAVRFAVY